MPSRLEALQDNPSSNPPKRGVVPTSNNVIWKEMLSSETRYSARQSHHDSAFIRLEETEGIWSNVMASGAGRYSAISDISMQRSGSSIAIGPGISDQPVSLSSLVMTLR